MKKSTSKKPKKKPEAKVHVELQGLDLSVNSFGQIITNVSIEKLNDFLDGKVIDRKLEEKKETEKSKNIKRKK